MNNIEYKKLHDVILHNHIGEVLYVSALVKSAEVRDSKKSDSKYLNITIVDQDTKQSLKIWNVHDNAHEGVKVDVVSIFHVQITTWNDKPQMELISIYDCEEDPKDYLPQEMDITPYLQTIQNTFATMNHDTIYYKVLRHIYDENAELFQVVPAAKTYHHNVKGGLIMHTATMLKAASRMCLVYTTLDWNLLAAAIMLHDMGKVKEYGIDEKHNITYAPMGSLKGHIVWAVSELEYVARQMGVHETNEMLALINAVASHHGKLEYGSPVTPYTLEARLISHLDMFDAEAYRVSTMLKTIGVGEVASTFINGGYEGVYKVN